MHTYADLLIAISKVPDDRLLDVIPAVYEELMYHVRDGKYRFLEPLAKGGQGFVCVAEDKRTLKKVAIKFALLDEEKKDAWWKFTKWKHANAHTDRGATPFINGGDTEHSKRFERGAILQKQIHKICKDRGLWQYGRVPAVHEIGGDPRRRWYVMEYIEEALTLLEWSKRTTDLKQRLELFRNILLFIEQALHKFHIVHSDLSHDNFLVAGNLPVLIDFGIAKNLADNQNQVTDIRSEGQGKPWTTSITQFNHFKLRSYTDDIFTLGTTLWVIVKQFFPPTAGRREDIPFHDVFSPDVLPDGIKEIFYRATCMDTQRWYKEISEMREDLERVLDGYKQKTQPLAKLPEGRELNWDKIEELLADNPDGELIRHIIRIGELICKIKLP